MTCALCGWAGLLAGFPRTWPCSNLREWHHVMLEAMDNSSVFRYKLAKGRQNTRLSETNVSCKATAKSTNVSMSVV